MSHEVVREAATRLGAGEQPAPGHVDAGLASIGMEMFWTTFIKRRLYHQTLTVKVADDVQSAMMQVDHRSRHSLPRFTPIPIRGRLAEDRDRESNAAREMLSQLVTPQLDRQALNLAQRFKGHTTAPFADDWVSGRQSWWLLSELLPNAYAYAAALDAVSVSSSDEYSADDALRMASGLALMLLAGVWAFRFDDLDTAILIPRPNVTVNAADEPHSFGAPAIEWPDAQAVWAYNAEIVPRAWIVNPERITIEQIERTRSLPRAEVMLDIYGPGRFMEERGDLQGEDHTGKLWRAAHPWQSSATWGAITVWLMLVEVVNSTAEPDGSFKTYWLRVPPHTSTPQQGVAWSFGLTPREYAPVVET